MCAAVCERPKTPLNPLLILLIAPLPPRPLPPAPPPPRPGQFFGIFPTGELVSDDPAAPWAEEIGQKVFLPPSIGVNETVRFTEVAFFHKKTRT